VAAEKELEQPTTENNTLPRQPDFFLSDGLLFLKTPLFSERRQADLRASVTPTPRASGTAAKKTRKSFGFS
jgi:hypothetical protein